MNLKRNALVLFAALAVTAAVQCAAGAETFEITKKVPVTASQTFTLRLHGFQNANKSGGYDRIAVYDGSRLVQTIKIANVSPYGDKSTQTYDPRGGQTTVVEDMNFDGFRDFRVQAETPAGPNIPYYCFLWEPKSGKFVHSKALDFVTSPEFDQKAKLVRSSNRDSAASYIEEAYKFENGKLTLMESTVTEYAESPDPAQPNKLLKTVTSKKRIDGKMKVVSTSTKLVDR